MMEKAVIEFLRKSGYTLSEIMKMDESANADTNADTNAETKTEENTETKTEENTETKTEIELKLEDLKNQIKELRDITHTQNIKHDVLEEEPEKPLEEQVEDLLKEVNK